MPVARRVIEAVVDAFIPSEQQKPIGEWFAEGFGNLVVEANAGTGKTTTIVWAVKKAPEQNIWVMSFAKPTADELSRRINDKRVTSSTAHSMGYRCIRQFGPGGKWNEVCKGFEREDWLAEQVSGALPFGGKRLVGKLVTLARQLQPTTATVSSLVDLAIDFNLMPPPGSPLTLGMVAEATLRAMHIAATVEPPTGIDYADQLYLPLRNGWVAPMFDMVVADEYQDLVPAQLAFIKAVAKSYARIVLVGDKRQAIYAFRGADSRSVEALKQELQPTELPLSVTYRCPKVAVRRAQQEVPTFTAADAAPEGVEDTIPDMDALLQAVTPGDFVLSRRRAPLARIAMAGLRKGIRIRIKGQDFAGEIKGLVRMLAKGDAANSVPRFLDRLRVWADKQTTRLIASKRHDKVPHIADTVETLRMLAQDAEGVPGLIARIDFLFNDKTDGHVVCSTVHKVKGLEANRVFLLESTFSRDKQEEANIWYVAVTRVKRHLTWVQEKF